jgi:predicted alpha/beta superfamily hydrolase
MRFATTRLLVALLLFPLPAAAQGRFDQITTIGHADSLWSKTLREYRPYLIYTPPSYADSIIGRQRYPVLYLLDGDIHFQSVSGLVHFLGADVTAAYVIPEMIVVAIPNTNRTRDLTPTHSLIDLTGTSSPGFDGSGGGPAFLEFMRAELIPHIEAQYRTLPYRVFVGHSLGGVMTLSALYTMPETFNAYVAIDPSLWWDDQLLVGRAHDYFSSAQLEGRTLYLAQANTINPADTTRNLEFESITRFNAIMQAYNSSGLRYGYRYYDRDNHNSVPLAAEYDALRFIFEGYKVPIGVTDEPALLKHHFDDISERFGAPFQPSRRQINLLVWFATLRDTANAIELAHSAIALYPNDSRNFERLGDIYATRGDTAQARTFYQQALARARDSERIRSKIARLGG